MSIPAAAAAAYRAAAQMAAPGASGAITPANIPGGNFKARLQWKPSSLGLAVRIRFANGDIFTTLESDTVQPYSPKPHLQISILLAMENVATGTEERQFLITS